MNDLSDESDKEEPSEVLAEIYEPKIRRALEAVCEEARERGLECSSIMDMTDDEYRWTVSIYPKGADAESGVDVQITILESEQNDGEEGGVNFGLDVVAYEGQVLGGSTPYNFTPNVWVDIDNLEEVEERWNIFDNSLDPGPITDAAEEYIRAHEEKPRSAKPKPAVKAGDLDVINRHRASIGMGPIDPAAGWTPDELAGMAKTIRETGRMANPGRESLKRKLMR